MIGVDPGALTLRELVMMAEARLRAEWDRTSHVLALIANCHRDPKRRKRPFSPAEFQPYRRPRTRPRRSMPVDRLAREIMAVGRRRDRPEEGR